MSRFSLFTITLLLPLFLNFRSAHAAADSSSINLRQTVDGIVVTVNSSKNLDDVKVSCDEGRNEIVVDLQGDVSDAVEALQKSRLVKPGGVSATPTGEAGMQRVRIETRARLFCHDIRLVSRFQRYMTHLIPAGLNLKITSAELEGFNFDEARPKQQVSGALLLNLSDVLGEIDLREAVISDGNTIRIRLNPRDFIAQERIPAALDSRLFTATTANGAAPGDYSLTLGSIKNGIIEKVAARAVKAQGGNQLKIEMTLSISLYESGKRLYEKGDGAAALTYLEAAKQNPATAGVARMSIGTIYWNDDKFAEAAKSFRELLDQDRGWNYPEARYFAAKAYHQANKRLSFELSGIVKEYLRRCDRAGYANCAEARELVEQVSEPELKVAPASKVEMKRLVAKLADPRQNLNEVQKNIFHFWATWCPLCLEEMPKIMKYAVAHPEINIYVVSKFDTQKIITNALIKAGAISRKNIFYYIDTKDDIMLRQMVPLSIATKEPTTPLPISVLLQRENPFAITERLNWTDAELSPLWRARYHE